MKRKMVDGKGDRESGQEKSIRLERIEEWAGYNPATSAVHPISGLYKLTWKGREYLVWIERSWQMTKTDDFIPEKLLLLAEYDELWYKTHDYSKWGEYVDWCSQPIDQSLVERLEEVRKAISR